MSEKAEINCCTAWVNVHLAAADCQAEDVVLDLLKGHRLRALLESEDKHVCSHTLVNCLLNYFMIQA